MNCIFFAFFNLIFFLQRTSQTLLEVGFSKPISTVFLTFVEADLNHELFFAVINGLKLLTNEVFEAGISVDVKEIVIELGNNA